MHVRKNKQYLYEREIMDLRLPSLAYAFLNKLPDKPTKSFVFTFL